MGNAIVVIIIVAILCAAGYKVWHDKKNGVKCSGCPHAPKGMCASKSTCSTEGHH